MTTFILVFVYFVILDIVGCSISYGGGYFFFFLCIWMLFFVVLDIFGYYMDIVNYYNGYYDYYIIIFLDVCGFGVLIFYFKN